MPFMTERETPSVDGLVIGILGGTGTRDAPRLASTRKGPLFMIMKDY
jgi:hypothetical protein